MILSDISFIISKFGLVQKLTCVINIIIKNTLNNPLYFCNNKIQWTHYLIHKKNINNVCINSYINR